MLDVSSCKLSFGGVKAVDDVSLRVEPGSITGLIGTNGAGKTTLFNVISGFLKADAGSIRFMDRDITARDPSEIAKLGILRTFQTPVGFPRMTVMENMLVFSRHDRDRRSSPFSPARVPAETLEAASAILADFGLYQKRDVWAEDLSAPDLKMLEFARAMMAGPVLLMLDEPAAGVNPALIESLASRIRALRDQGVSFLLVDHNLKFVCNVCDRIFAMADGRIIAEGTPDEVIADQKVLELYIGKSAKTDLQ
ncbi:ABC transporter ATP-binding protein [Methylobrevis pamukkalensis]|uniref:Lipopolysaccharide export system ATP-binding protein LptB n=1 Tax=Methylobrevis pamukkalensis TaxID=1439726 RepID=A0A1E3H937_9HYPH|nr:ABC transporter ATP-binding protein [Methylobrevis pamukkalensis]ODN72306.1 Lipopolysaccharide export system ATP-binding protein LptB [Methylobrevis pamukkalensis]